MDAERDGDNCNALRTDSPFKLGGEPGAREQRVCSHATMSRLENALSWPEAACMTSALVDLFCCFFPDRSRDRHP